ncbi:MAG: M1 family metallopeptidase [Bacteroidetes bacterium]|nr:M1 family metallopeptidase [Bacteroidota bacterium]
MSIRISLLALFIAGIINFNCSQNGNNMEMLADFVADVSNHSYSKPEEVIVTHLDLDIEVDFENKMITGKASYQIDNKSGSIEMYLDIRQMEIEKVTLGEDETETAFAVGPEPDSEYLGRPLKIAIDADTKQVNIYYSTKPEAAALQWLAPEQTEGKVHPFLFTQSQAILARTWVPCQDAPGIRYTYNATVKVPKELMAVMSAGNPTEKNAEGIYKFVMAQPIPSYLMALAVGDIVFKPIGDRTGVYAEPAMIDTAVREFSEMEDMLLSAEKLYGAYRWDRYDVIVLPPSFPFGGMENPRLTFATPTVIAGDRSLVSLIAHELAHSWSGNLVTNATWDDFWLNEGFTVYFERRIMEEIHDKPYTDMLSMAGYQDLQDEIKRQGENSDDTKLKLNLSDRDPDDGMTNIAYEKGSLFVTHIENVVGREKLDAFLKTYFNKFAFKSMTTEKFIEYLEKELIAGDDSLAKRINLASWVYSPGIPEDHPVRESKRFEFVEENLAKWLDGTKSHQLSTQYWSTHEWLHFLRNMPDTITEERLVDLDSTFNFTASGNAEILCIWFQHTIKHNYTASFDSLEHFLMKVGRRKFLEPLYKELVKSEEGKKRAESIYAKARPNYHSVSTNTLDEILGWE